MDKLDLNDFWLLLAGLGILLYGMLQLENALKEFAGRSFKLFLRKYTGNKYKAIFGGTIVTGLLQSSSLVTIIVLSFVGAGVISMRNAMGIVFGSNLGTTLDSWIVATIGFKLDILKIALPVVGFSGLALVLTNSSRKIYPVLKFCMGFGLLFLGLNFMKDSIEQLFKEFDFTPYLQSPRILFVLLGFVITAIIQSSSATMIIVLSALNAKVFPFETAVAIVIGSELGTTIKILIGSIGGIAAKRRIALGNIIFNCVITVSAYIFMFPAITLITKIVGKEEPLIALVMFQTMINLAGVIIFLPFMDKFADWLEKVFSDKDNTATRYIQSVNPVVDELALEMMEKETFLFLYRTIKLNAEGFEIDHLKGLEKDPFKEFGRKQNNEKTLKEKYDHLKRSEGEILSFYIKMRESKMDEKDFIRLNHLLMSVKNAMYSAKGMKDVLHDRKNFYNSADETKFGQFKLLKKQLHDFYIGIIEILKLKDRDQCYKQLEKMVAQITKDQDVRMKTIYEQSEKDTLEKLDLSTLLNVNRELFSSCKALIFSVKDLVLESSQADKFNDIPVSI